MRERVDQTRNEGKSIKRSWERERREKKGTVCVQIFDVSQSTLCERR